MRTSILFTFSLLLFTSPALTREEIVDRFTATPVVMVDGLVEVAGTCSAETRREYQLSVAGYAAEICRSLYAGDCETPRRFLRPGIVIHLGDTVTNVTNVVSRVHTRADGTPYTKIYLPSPGFSDRSALTLAVAQAHYLAVKGERLDAAEAWHRLLASNPELRAAETCRRLGDWSQRGIYAEGMDDEQYLTLARKVLLPGRLTEYERTTFASRLYLYPPCYDAPFCGRYTSIDLRTAVALRKKDPRIRFAAYVKARQVLIFGAGRGPGLQAAADAYANFLNELGRDKLEDGELLGLLATAEERLKGACE